MTPYGPRLSTTKRAPPRSIPGTTTSGRSQSNASLRGTAAFLSEGIQKFIYPALRGAGRFEGMGFPNPEFTATFVGVFEILCGMALLTGLLTRPAALAMIINMTVAIAVTKIPIAFAESFGPFVLRDLKIYGFWSMAHEMRTDFAMWLGSLFLLIKGGGRWSLDLIIEKKLTH